MTLTVLVGPLYSVLNVNLMFLVTEPLTYSRTLSMAKLSEPSASSVSICERLVRRPPPTVTGGRVCAWSVEPADTHSHETASAANGLRQRSRDTTRVSTIGP